MCVYRRMVLINPRRITSRDLVNLANVISFNDIGDSMEILPLNKSIELKNAKFMWRLNNGFLPESLANNFRSNARTNVTNSISRLDSLKRFILFAGPNLWNELPSCITSKPSLNSFSNALKNYFIHGTISDTHLNSRGTRGTRGVGGSHISRLDNNTGLNRAFVSRWNQLD